MFDPATSKMFHNHYYHDDWKEFVPTRENVRYAEGHASFNPDGSLTVYDGDNNFMGTITAEGVFVYNDPVNTEYEDTFLRAAKEMFFK